MSELSPAAQAVLDAYWASPWDPCLQQEDRHAIAAALRAAADQVVPAPRRPYHSCCDAYAAGIRAELLAIAGELEAE
ncbi:MAG: hypothetical protein EBS78_11845 [Altererythrobacter sp.]|nr:hypothetical protein [Altererythrobacter sp.]